MGIDVFGKFSNRQVDGKLMDYKDIDYAPIIEMDLNSPTSAVLNNYYRHTGTTGEYVNGVVYLYNGTEYKAIDGSGDLRNVQEVETSEIEPGSIDIDETVTANSKNVVTSGAVYKAIDSVRNVVSEVQKEVGNIPKITVDSTLNGTSTNPVQNKTINAKIEQIQNQITEIGQNIDSKGDYVDTKSTQTITGTKIFENVQVDDILFKTEDGKGYNCHLTGNPEKTPDSMSPLKVYLPKNSGTLALESKSLMGSSYESITTSENYLFDSKISIPLSYGFVFKQHTYEIEWSYDNPETSHHLSTIGNVMLDAGSLAHEDKYMCHSAFHYGSRVDFFAMISIDDEDSSDNGKFELGVNIQGAGAGDKHIYIHSIRAIER